MIHITDSWITKLESDELVAYKRKFGSGRMSGWRFRAGAVWNYWNRRICPQWNSEQPRLFTQSRSRDVSLDLICSLSLKNFVSGMLPGMRSPILMLFPYGAWTRAAGRFNMNRKRCRSWNHSQCSRICIPGWDVEPDDFATTQGGIKWNVISRLGA